MYGDSERGPSLPGLSGAAPDAQRRILASASALRAAGLDDLADAVVGAVRESEEVEERHAVASPERQNRPTLFAWQLPRPVGPRSRARLRSLRLLGVGLERSMVAKLQSGRPRSAPARTSRGYGGGDRPVRDLALSQAALYLLNVAIRDPYRDATWRQALPALVHRLRWPITLVVVLLLLGWLIARLQ